MESFATADASPGTCLLRALDRFDALVAGGLVVVERRLRIGRHTLALCSTCVLDALMTPALAHLVVTEGATGGADPVVKESRFERGTGTFTVPARTTAVPICA